MKFLFESWFWMASNGARSLFFSPCLLFLCYSCLDFALNRVYFLNIAVRYELYNMLFLLLFWIPYVCFVLATNSRFIPMTLIFFFDYKLHTHTLNSLERERKLCRIPTQWKYTNKLWVCWNTLKMRNIHSLFDEKPAKKVFKLTIYVRFLKCMYLLFVLCALFSL